VSRTRSQSSSSIIGARPSARTPALFTSTSTGPNSSSSAVKSASAVRGRRRRLERLRAPAGLDDLLDHGVRRVLVER
jgi:hypothetical protein